MTDEWPSWPSFGLADDIRPALAEAAARGTPVAIACRIDVIMEALPASSGACTSGNPPPR